MKAPDFPEEMDKADLVCAAMVESVRDTGRRDYVHGIHYAQPVTYPVREASLKVLVRVKVARPVPDTIKLLYKAHGPDSPRDNGAGLLRLKVGHSMLFALRWDEGQQAYRLSAADPDPEQAAIFVSPRVKLGVDLSPLEDARSIVWQTVTDEELPPVFRAWALNRYPELRFPGTPHHLIGKPSGPQFSEGEFILLRRLAGGKSPLSVTAIWFLGNYGRDAETLMRILLDTTSATANRTAALQYLLHTPVRENQVDLPWLALVTDKDTAFVQTLLDYYPSYHEKVPTNERRHFAEEALKRLRSRDAFAVSTGTSVLITQDRDRFADVVLMRMEASDATTLSAMSVALCNIFRDSSVLRMYNPNKDADQIIQYWRKRLAEPLPEQ